MRSEGGRLSVKLFRVLSRIILAVSGLIYVRLVPDL